MWAELQQRDAIPPLSDRTFESHASRTLVQIAHTGTVFQKYFNFTYLS